MNGKNRSCFYQMSLIVVVVGLTASCGDGAGGYGEDVDTSELAGKPGGGSGSKPDLTLTPNPVGSFSVFTGISCGWGTSDSLNDPRGKLYWGTEWSAGGSSWSLDSSVFDRSTGCLSISGTAREAGEYRVRLSQSDNHNGGQYEVASVLAYLTAVVQCGNAHCEVDESCSSCAADCGTCSTCGDGACNGVETCSTCSGDCGACPPPPGCGDGQCNGDETCETCAGDCGVCEGTSCGDGTCNGLEECLSCPADCGPC